LSVGAEASARPGFDWRYLGNTLTQKMAERSTESEVLAQQLEHLSQKIESLEARVQEVEVVIPRLETAAETTARAMEEVSTHWDAVYKAMRRAE
jgi:predicted nuclease with TOPRIM domain